MAVSYGEVQQAFNAKSAAEAALQAAEAEEAQIVNDPAARATGAYDAAKSKTQAARGALQRATSSYSTISTQYNKENPNKPATPQTPSQTATVATEAEKDKNEKQTGIRETDVQRAARERAEAPKPVRPDSPVQQQNAATAGQNANTSSQRAADTATNNAQRNQLAIINAQKDALYKAGVLYNTARGQASQEAQQGVQAQQKGIDQTLGAGKSLLEQDVQKRQRDLDLKKTRTTFFSNMLSSAMPQVAELMMKSGGKAAASFLKVYVLMANEAMSQAKLDQEEPPFDETSPWYQNIVKIAGYKTPDQIPAMPTADQISWQAAKIAAVGNFPVGGWQAGTGIDALSVPDMPAGTNGAGVDPIAEAASSPEGVAIRSALQDQIKDVVEKQKAGQPLTPEEQQRYDSARESYKDQMDKLAARNAATPRPSPELAESQSLKQQIREGLVSGDPNQRLRIMAAAQAAYENQQAGLPLTEEQSAVMANLDPEDLKIIQQHMTPDIAQILVRHQKGQQPTPEEVARVQTALTTTSTQIKQRPLTPEQAPVMNQSIIDPNVVKAQEEESIAKKQERDRIAAENPTLGAMMNQVEDEQRQMGAQARQNGEMIQMNTLPLREQAEQRLRLGEQPKPDYFDQPGKLIQDTGTATEGAGDNRPIPNFIDSTKWGTTPEVEQPTPEEEPMPKLFDTYKSLADQYESQGVQPTNEMSTPWPATTEESIPNLAPQFDSYLNQDEEEEERQRKQRQSLFSPSFSF